MGGEIFTKALLLATDYFVHYLRIFRGKDISTARNMTEKGEVLRGKDISTARNMTEKGEVQKLTAG